MADELLFCKYDLSLVIENQRAALLKELDAMSDSRLLNTDLAELQSYMKQKYQLEMIELGEPSIDEGRTKMQVGRYGGFHRGYDGGAVSVDAQRYTLEIPFTGDKDLFFCRGSTFNMNPPRGTVKGTIIATTMVERQPTADQVNATFERFLKDLDEHLGWLRPAVVGWNESISAVVDSNVKARRARADQTGAVASGLKFALKQRNDRAATFAAPVASRKKIAPQLPQARPVAPPEPALSDAIYRDILDTLQQMAEVMERSPHAYADMDEETLRFQFLVPLNAKFEGEARGEVFNYGGKTDILITSQGRNIFIGECKIWKGEKALSEAIDQVLGYLSWRDTKAAILLFNRNRSFSNVLEKIRPTVEKHPQCTSFDGKCGETEFAFTFARIDDASRKLKLTLLAFDVPGHVEGDSSTRRL
ncbi:hypothetical protein F1645_13605 [Novacetimonas hansenii]|uniref:Uncharacterized protein n=2 Tax=Novacetimonas hansenii TaxID=436 RepID=A0ABQ0SIX6_NOVHA|nr:hypothetical protein [Novacetimonas hansenii]EFG85474.1 hypothetical protein GXY_03013 [Novacetimonas hansenii ATCC 23769]GAN83738.1 hypothetical protein Gaha_0101_008 [Novacetimonas hansenii JCM 7643]GBQ61487.1 hypothetical protein AA0243_2669 [Novacetimonas hansenii NRIC 0243]GEC65138.1 hypothetical protein GHA01_29870 [Novacetimonas hansenii]